MTNKYSLIAWHDDDRFANEVDHDAGIIYDTPINGLFQIHWPNGNKRYEWYYKDGKRADGVSRGWWPDGKLKQIIGWQDWVKDGLHTIWDENGNIEDEINYKGGKRDGLWIKFSQRKTGGEKMEERTYKNGKKDGLFTFWYENGQKMYEGTFKDGKPDGPFTVWYENGEKKCERTYKDGELKRRIDYLQ
jgi:antitoxin component YwqK of YwqJK toxin-antitoxin module